MENLSRTLAIAGKDLYIISGPLGEGGTGLQGPNTKIGRNQVAVPASLWKIVVVIDKPGLGVKGVTVKTRVTAVNIPNTTAIKNKSYQDYLTTVDDLEQLTGYDFLSDIPKEIQDVIEARKDGE